MNSPGLTTILTASANVEDGELKRMFGDHISSVQGRSFNFRTTFRINTHPKYASYAGSFIQRNSFSSRDRPLYGLLTACLCFCGDGIDPTSFCYVVHALVCTASDLALFYFFITRSFSVYCAQYSRFLSAFFRLSVESNIALSSLLRLASLSHFVTAISLAWWAPSNPFSPTLTLSSRVDHSKTGGEISNRSSYILISE